MDKYKISLPQVSNHSSKDLLSQRNIQRNNYDSDKFEAKYKEVVFKLYEKLDENNIKLLLPIKTENGIIKKHKIKYVSRIPNHRITKLSRKDNRFSLTDYFGLQNMKGVKLLEPITTLQLLSYREEKLELLKYYIGLVSSELLEYPNEKSKNFKILLNYMEDKTLETNITIRKLATASLLEIFKDLLPLYNIKNVDRNGIRLKKETLHLQNHENMILSYYKVYLRNLEKMASLIKNAKFALFSKEDFYLGYLAVFCMSNILAIHPNFNYSSNIAKFLIPFLNSKYKKIRLLVSKCFKQIFKEDTTGKLSLSVLCYLYQYLKKQTNLLNVEVLSVLLSLPVVYIKPYKYDNLFKLKEFILYTNINKSKKEKNKHMNLIAKEILNTKRNCNEEINIKILREIITLVFRIYFHILKEFGNSEILSLCLKGLSKFSPYINTYFQNDLICCLDTMIIKKNLSLREQLDCIHAILNITVQTSSLLSINLNRFIKHFYNILKNIHIGRRIIELNISVKILQIIFDKRNVISQNCLSAFVKRICLITLMLEHNDAINIINTMKNILHNVKITSIFLHTVSNIERVYVSEINDSEYYNVCYTSLWEIVALQRHYYIPLKNITKIIISEMDQQFNFSIKNSKRFFEDNCKYYTSTGLFKPFTIPKKVSTKSIYKNKFLNKFKNGTTKIYVDIFNDLHTKIIL